MTDHWPLLLRGLLLGFSIAAPVGPIGVLCIRRALADGFVTGFLSGLGAATADMLYGATAAFGLTALTGLLVSQQDWLRLIGGIFLLYLGIRTFLAKPANQAASVRATGGLGAYASTLALTITNPMTILSFIAMFSAILPAGKISTLASAQIVLGVFLGSAAWWLTLSGLVSLVRERFTPVWTQWVNRLSGLIIFGFAVRTMLDLLG